MMGHDMNERIVTVCRLTTRLAVINLTAIGLALAGGVVAGLLPSMAAAHAASSQPLSTPIPRLARGMIGTWKRSLLRVNAVGLPLLLVGVLAIGLLRGVEGPLLRAPLLAAAIAALAGAITAAALAGLDGGGTVRGLLARLAALWLARPWAPPLLLGIWGLAALAPFLHPLLGLYLMASVAALAGNRLLDRALTTACVVTPPFGQGADQ